MATLDDVRRIAGALPETTESPARVGAFWRVKKRGFVWERPLGKSDQKALADLGEEIPAGAIIGVRVPDEGVKFALIAAEPEIFFTIPHFNGYAAVLVKLDQISVAELEEIVTEAWLDRAPPKLAQAYRAAHPPTPRAADEPS